MAKRLLVKVNEADNVAIAVKEIKAGTQVSEDLVTRQDIPQAHKVALERIPKGQPVIRYGVILGYCALPNKSGRRNKSYERPY